MRNVLEIRVSVTELKLSQRSMRALAHLDSYDWILFTSKHAVRFFGGQLRARRIPLPRAARIAAVGPTTAASLHALGLPVHLVPERYTLRDLIRKLGRVTGARIVFPRSAIAPDDMVKTLRARGARVTVVPVYTTAASPLARTTRRALLRGAYARIMFRSPSGVRGLLQQLTADERKVVRRIPAQCIGPTTARAARAGGFEEVSTKSV